MCLGLSRETGTLRGEMGLSSMRKTGTTWNTTLLFMENKGNTSVFGAAPLCWAGWTVYQSKDSVLDISADAVSTHTKRGGSLQLEVVQQQRI